MALIVGTTMEFSPGEEVTSPSPSFGVTFHCWQMTRYSGPRPRPLGGGIPTWRSLTCGMRVGTLRRRMTMCWPSLMP